MKDSHRVVPYTDFVEQMYLILNCDKIKHLLNVTLYDI